MDTIIVLVHANKAFLVVWNSGQVAQLGSPVFATNLGPCVSSQLPWGVWKAWTWDQVFPQLQDQLLPFPDS